jgi:hypothetical protein
MRREDMSAGRDALDAILRELRGEMSSLHAAVAPPYVTFDDNDDWVRVPPRDASVLTARRAQPQVRPPQAQALPHIHAHAHAHAWRLQQPRQAPQPRARPAPLMPEKADIMQAVSSNQRLDRSLARRFFVRALESSVIDASAQVSQPARPPASQQPASPITRELAHGLTAERAQDVAGTVVEWLSLNCPLTGAQAHKHAPGLSLA